MSDSLLFNRISIIGCGLIGSSLARAIKAQGICKQLIGYDADEEARKRIVKLKLFDKVTVKLEEEISDADLVIICTPLGAFQSIALKIAPFMKAGAILSDVGSCKLSIIEALLPLLPDNIQFIPAHPIAGTEFSGPDAGFAELFQDRYTILTPPDGTDQKAQTQLTLLWQKLGARVEIMEPYHHDRVLAITSHLPHVIAYALVRTAGELETQLKLEKADDQTLVHTGEVLRYSAGGFRDFTRIADSNPIMWRDIFLHNKEAVLEMLGRFSEDLSSLQRAIRWQDGQALEDWFTSTKAVRRAIIELNQAGTFIATEDKTRPKDQDQKFT